MWATLSSFRGFTLLRLHRTVAYATVGHMNMVAETSTRRGDEQPEPTRHEMAKWTKTIVLYSVACLRPAIEKATQLASNGREVVALMRTRPSEIVVSSGQVQKMTNRLIESQVSPWPRVAVVIIDTADGCDCPLSALMPNGAVHREATVNNAMLRK